MFDRDQIEASLATLVLEEQVGNAANYLQSVSYKGDTLQLSFAFETPCFSLFDRFAEQLHSHLVDALGELDLDLDFAIDIKPTMVTRDVPLVDGVQNVVLVASGKGGVGKSTTSVNLARALSHEGARVGILDADIYGPSIPLMFGVPEGTRPAVIKGKGFEPIEVDGIQTMSLGYLTTDKTPAVWRGPMASSALVQMMQQTQWGELDYLIVDMPPGTGDIQLTMAQKIAVSGAVVVTTPQNVALLDAQKAVEMFAKVQIPVVGIIENMSYHICNSCGHKEHIFGADGGLTMAEQYQVELLGGVPINVAIRDAADNGHSLREGEVQKQYQLIARRFGRALAKLEPAQLPTITEIDD